MLGVNGRGELTGASPWSSPGGVFEEEVGGAFTGRREGVRISERGQRSHERFILYEMHTSKVHVTGEILFN